MRNVEVCFTLSESFFLVMEAEPAFRAGRNLASYVSVGLSLPLSLFETEFPFRSWDLHSICILPAKKEVHSLNGLWSENVACTILLS